MSYEFREPFAALYFLHPIIVLAVGYLIGLIGGRPPMTEAREIEEIALKPAQTS